MMRVASRAQFRVRQSAIRQPKKRYFLAFEGEVDELRYFMGMMHHFRREYPQAQLFEVIAFRRPKEFLGHSNPIQVFNQLLKALTTGMFELSLRYNEVLENFLDVINNGYLYGKERSAYYTFAQKFLSQHRLQLNSIATEPHLTEFVTNLHARYTQSLKSIDGLMTLEEILQEYERDDIAYDAASDEVCIVVDRDRESFTSEQYDEVAKKCDENNYRLFISTPCFEFFLLLHKSDCREFPESKLLENKKIGEHSYVENRLRKILPTYKKGRVNFLDYKDDLTAVIDNHRLYASSLSALKNSAGSNLPQLIEEFISNVS